MQLEIDGGCSLQRKPSHTSTVFRTETDFLDLSKGELQMKCHLRHLILLRVLMPDPWPHNQEWINKIPGKTPGMSLPVWDKCSLCWPEEAQRSLLGGSFLHQQLPWEQNTH